MSDIGKIIRVNALPPPGKRENNVIYQVAAPGAATYKDYAIDANGDLKTPSYIPLTGTVEGKPLTKNIEVDPNQEGAVGFISNTPDLSKAALTIQEDGSVLAESRKDTDSISSSVYMHHGTGVEISATTSDKQFSAIVDTSGLQGDDYILPASDEHYVQRKYITDNFTSQTTLNSTLADYYTSAETDDLFYDKTEVDAKLSAVYRPKGSVANFASLPSSGNTEGDVWNILDTGSNYVWVINLNNTGVPGWDKLSETVDLTAYATLNTPQEFEARKIFRPGIGNRYDEASLELRGSNANSIYPTVSFHQPGVYAGTISLRNSNQFSFKNTDDSDYNYLLAKGYIKSGFDDNSLLLAGGGAKQISDFITNDSWNNITGKKWFKTDGGNTWDNNTIRIQGINGSDAGLTFFRDGIDVGQIIFDGYYFNLTNSENTGYKELKTAGYIKIGSDGNHLLLGDGNHKAVSDFVLDADIANVFRNNSIKSNFIPNVATTLDAELPNGGFITSYYDSAWGGSDRPNGASYGGYIKYAGSGGNLDLDIYYNNGHNGTSPRLWYRTKEAVNGVRDWMEFWTTNNFNPNDYHKIDFTDSVNNGSDTRTNKSWFDYNWAGTGNAGSVINFSGHPNLDYSTELFARYLDGNIIGIRTRNGDTETWNPVRYLFHSGNFNPGDYVPQVGDYNIYNIKSFFGAYTQWILDGDYVNNARGFVQSLPGGFLTGTLNDKNFAIYRNAQEKIVVEDLKTTFNQNIKATGNYISAANIAIGDVAGVVRINRQSANDLGVLSESNGWAYVNAAGFKRSGSDDNHILTGGGGHRPASDFALSSSLGNYLPLSGGTLTGGGVVQDNGNIILQQTNVGGNATGLFWETIDNAGKMSGIGALTQDGAFEFNYIGWGASPWTTPNNLAVGQSRFTYKDNKVFHAGETIDYSDALTNIISAGGSTWGWRKLLSRGWNPTYGFFSEINVPSSVSTSASFILSENGNGYIGDKTVWHEGNFNPDNYIPKTHPVYNVSQYYLDGWYGYKPYEDNRGIAPNHLGPHSVQHGFGSWDNNNNAPYADYLHFGGYSDGSGGNQNLIMFSKNGFGLRQYQSSVQGASPYSSYVDYWHTGNFNPASKANAMQSATGVGFSSGNLPTNDGVEYPYFYYNNGTDQGFIPIATQGWVNNTFATKNQLNDYVTRSTNQIIDGSKTFSSSSTVDFKGNDQNNVIVYKTSTGVAGLVSGHEYTHYNTRWRVGNRRGDGTNSLGYSFEFSNDYGATYTEKARIDEAGFFTGNAFVSPVLNGNQVFNANNLNQLFFGNPSVSTVYHEAGSLHAFSAGGNYSLYINSEGVAVNGALSINGQDVATQNWITSGFIPSSQKGAANGIATLDTNGLIPTTQLPSYVDDVLEFTNLTSFPNTGEAGKIYVALDTNKTYRWSGSSYIYITSGAVDSVNGQTGVVNLSKTDIGLANADNTSDAVKNVLSATKWTTPRTLSYTGDVIGSASVDGSGNVGFAMTLANSGVSAGTYNSVNVDAKGRVLSGNNVNYVTESYLTTFLYQNYFNQTASDERFVNANGDEVINGNKTFTSSPAIPAATNGDHAVNLEQLTASLSNVVRDNDDFEILEVYRLIDSNPFDLDDPRIKKYNIVFEGASNGSVNITYLRDNQYYQFSNVSGSGADLRIIVEGYGAVDAISPGKTAVYMSWGGGKLLKISENDHVSII